LFRDVIVVVEFLAFYHLLCWTLWC